VTGPADPSRTWWPLERLLAEVRPGSYDGDWTWEQEHDDLWFGPNASQSRMDALATSMQLDGQREPVIVGDDGRLWDGHHRVAVAMRLGFEEVLVVRYEDMTDEERDEYLVEAVGGWEAGL